MRVLLTGAGGFIGAHTLAHFMHNTGWIVVCTDSFRHKGKTDRIRQMLDAHPEWKSRVEVYTHDLNAPISPQLAHAFGTIEYIFNLASESHVDRSITDPIPFIQNNVNLALNILEYAKQVVPRACFMISTDEVYGAAPPNENHKEWATILPSNPYSASKAAQEAIAISYWRTYNVPVVITNTMNNIGEMQDPEKFVPMLIQKINKGETVTIHGNPERIGSRFYLHARNHADALLFLSAYQPTLYSDSDLIVRPDRYNVVGNEEIDNLSLAQMVAKYVGKPLKYELIDFHATRPGHDRRYALDGTKITAMGWKAPVAFDESLKHTVAWTLEHKEWLL